MAVRLRKNEAQCPVCGGGEFASLLTPQDLAKEGAWLKEFYASRSRQTKDKAEFTQNETTYVLQCEECATLLRHPQPPEESVESRYESDTYGRDALMNLLETQAPFFQGKADAIALPGGACVLEVGAFTGAFLLAAKKKGWQATGLDIGIETTDFMRGNGLDVRRGDVACIGAGEKFDAVFIWNTFDQLSDPIEALEKVRGALRDGALLVLRVPNGLFEQECIALRQTKHSERFLQHVMLAQAYNNFLTFPYLYGYTPASLTKLLQRQGFRVDEIKGDVLAPIADDRTEKCAAKEERRYKRAVARACSLCPERFPWLDVFARRA